jgi:hypothetical protein
MTRGGQRTYYNRTITQHTPTTMAKTAAAALLNEQLSGGFLCRCPLASIFTVFIETTVWINIPKAACPGDRPFVRY